MKVILNQFSAVKRSLKNKFVQNMATMLAGNITAQALGLLAVPVLTRLYTPNDFGIMTFIQSGAGIFSVIACFRYRFSILLPAEDEQSNNLLTLSLLATVFTTLFLLMVIILFKNVIAQNTELGTYGNYLFFIVFIVFIVGSRETLVFFHTRLKNYKIISISIILMTIIGLGVKIGAVFFFSASAFWLVMGNVVGPLLSGLILFICLRQIVPEIKKNVNLAGIRKVAQKYYRFPLYNMPTALINSISENLPVLLFAYYFSNKVVGLYGLANVVLKKPLDVISQSISKVFFEKSSALVKDGGDLYKDLKKTTLALFGIGIVPVAVMTIWGSTIFQLIFGAEWKGSGIYAQILSVYLFVLMINKPSAQIYFVKNLLRENLYFKITNLLLILLAFFIGMYNFNSDLICLLLFSLFGVALNAVYIAYAFLNCKKCEQ